jgi:hypothetical protein
MKLLPSVLGLTTGAVDVISVLGLGGLFDSNKVRSAGRRAWRTGPVIAGFVVGCSLGAAYEAAYGLWSLVLPTGFAVAALALGFNVSTVAVVYRMISDPLRPARDGKATERLTGTAPGARSFEVEVNLKRSRSNVGSRPTWM